MQCPRRRAHLAALRVPLLLGLATDCTLLQAERQRVVAPAGRCLHDVGRQCRRQQQRRLVRRPRHAAARAAGTRRPQGSR